MQREAIQFPPKDSGLREDVHALGDLIGEVLRDQGGEEFFETLPTVGLDQFRRSAISVLATPSADHNTSWARATRA